ncbi:hypothetical protein [Spirosoma fluminis]
MSFSTDSMVLCVIVVETDLYSMIAMLVGRIGNGKLVLIDPNTWFVGDRFGYPYDSINQ